MSEDVIVFGWIVIVIDVVLLIGVVGCMSYNFIALLKYNELNKDVSFRALMLGMSVMYVLANYQALQRHMDTFLGSTPMIMSDQTIESLLNDRSFMLATGFFMVLLTIKYVPSWFHKN